MKKYIVGALALVATAVTMNVSTASTAEAAGSWYRVSCDYEAGTGYVGVYRSSYGSGNYFKTLVFRSYCPFSVS